MAYSYYKPGESGYDSSMPRTCPKCYNKSYSSIYLNNHCGGSAQCPYCGYEF